MDVKDFYYDLPQELIAQDPLEDRSSSRKRCLGDPGQTGKKMQDRNQNQFRRGTSDRRGH